MGGCAHRFIIPRLFQGSIHFNTYAWSKVRTQMNKTIPGLCLRVNRKMLPSSPTRPLAAVATEMLWGEIIFPQTPPDELAATVRAGLTPICSAVVLFPNESVFAVCFADSGGSPPLKVRLRKNFHNGLALDGP